MKPYDFRLAPPRNFFLLQEGDSDLLPCYHRVSGQTEELCSPEQGSWLARWALSL